ncbi:putative jun dimerization protein 2 [Triplophysa rosa]|uniref:Jun dimerization protein 2 n=1 Tax=Triplophysa rosa TaxID=992332 RepID=A0A9W7TWQ5_TRIRA|nr:putative jun dimerization protein 2 [Triplophysa rosa]
MQRFPLFKIYSRPRPDVRKGLHPLKSGAVTGVCDMMPGQIPDPSVTAASLASLGPLAGISATTLTDQLKYADLCNLGAMLSPFHLLGKLKRPLPIKAERDEEEERRKRRREKNKVAAARCRNKKKERTEYLQKESERLEMMNSELKAQIEELKHERQQLILMLNRHRPTCIVRTDSVKTPEKESNPLLEQLEKSESRLFCEDTSYMFTLRQHYSPSPEDQKQKSDADCCIQGPPNLRDHKHLHDFTQYNTMQYNTMIVRAYVLLGDSGCVEQEIMCQRFTLIRFREVMLFLEVECCSTSFSRFVFEKLNPILERFTNILDLLFNRGAEAISSLFRK